MSTTLLRIQVGDLLLAYRHAFQITFDRGLEVLDAILDYPSYFKLMNTFVHSQETFSSAVSVLEHSQQAYKHGLLRTGTFVENHDQPRLGSETKDPGVCCP
jgi:glycosidase